MVARAPSWRVWWARWEALRWDEGGRRESEKGEVENGVCWAGTDEREGERAGFGAAEGSGVDGAAVETVAASSAVGAEGAAFAFLTCNSERERPVSFLSRRQQTPQLGASNSPPSPPPESYSHAPTWLPC